MCSTGAYKKAAMLPNSSISKRIGECKRVQLLSYIFSHLHISSASHYPHITSLLTIHTMGSYDLPPAYNAPSYSGYQSKDTIPNMFSNLQQPNIYPDMTLPQSNTTSTSPTLRQPIAIPATAANLGSPFLRAYPTELSVFNLPPSDFLAFLDELNRLMVVSPPVKVLGLAGDIVGLVPLPTAQIVGGAVKAASIVASYGMSKARSEMFIKEANEKLFTPRGLKANIVKLEVVARVARVPILDAGGKITKDAKLLAPVEAHENGMPVQQRRLLALAPYTSPLQVLSNEHQSVPTNIFDKIHASASERQRSSEEAKALKKRGKQHEGREKDLSKAQRDFDKDMRKLGEEEDKVKRKEAKKPEKMARELEKLDREREKVQRKFEGEARKGGSGRKRKDKEEQAVRKILWLLIQPREQVW
jgi:hypothetical protein